MASNPAPIFEPPAKGISGVFEVCVGVDSEHALEAQVRYWAEFGYNEACDFPRGELVADDAMTLYGVFSSLVSVRLFHQDSDHGLVRLMWFRERVHTPPLNLKNLRVLGARWGAQLTENVYNIVHHADDAAAAGSDITTIGPSQSVVYRHAGACSAPEPFHSAIACVREYIFIQKYTVQNAFQRFEYTVPRYGKVNPASKFKASQITHVGIIAQGEHAQLDFYENTLGLMKTTHDEGREFSFDNAEQADKDILGLKKAGDRFNTTNFDSPESSMKVQEYLSGRIHVLRYAADVEVPDCRQASRPGTIGPNNYTLRLAKERLVPMHEKVKAAAGVTEATPCVTNEFGESSFSFVAPDGYFWTLLQDR